MEAIVGFCDLCIPYSKNHIELKNLLTELCELGYKLIAIEQTYDDRKKEMKRGADPFPEPPSLEFLNEFKGKLKILNRLTIIYENPSITHAMSNSQTLLKYNVIAGKPVNNDAFQHCCSTFNGDLITIPEDSDYLIIRKNYNIAVRRGMCFEIQYSEMITNSTYRKKMIVISHSFHTIGKSKNVIITSGAKNLFQIRGPHDIANLGIILGLSEEQSKYSIVGQCRSLLIRAEARKYGKSVMFVKQLKNTIEPYYESDDSEIKDFTTTDDDDDDNDDDDEDDDDEDDDDDEQPKKKLKLE